MRAFTDELMPPSTRNSETYYRYGLARLYSAACYLRKHGYAVEDDAMALLEKAMSDVMDAAEGAARPSAQVPVVWEEHD